MNSSPSANTELHRGLGPWQATALNIANMVGIGPFITIPTFLAAMQGPQALIAWVIAAVLVLCDGLVWSELGAALPGSGGSYHFLSEIYARFRYGRIVPFLFIWQFLVSGTLELASGYIGGVKYLEYPFPGLDARLVDAGLPGGSRTLAAAAAVTVTLVLCRNIRWLGGMGLVLCGGTLVTLLLVIAVGYANFDSSLVTFPENAFRIEGNSAFVGGLGGAMTIAVYDYLGYYNICHLGDEVVSPGRTIPRAVMLSVVIVGTLYLTMNLAIIGVVPWQQAMKSEYVASEFMEILFGRRVAVLFTWMILWTVVACVFAMTLGYSRIPYAAARNGGFFRIFSVLHPVHRYPIVSLLTIGGFTAVFCYFPLEVVINAAVIVRIAVQFIGQLVGLHILRTTRPDVPLPFRMWLYPVPSLVALVGWVFLLVTAEPLVLVLAIEVLGWGCVAYFVWREFNLGEAAYLRLISGETSDLGAVLTRACLQAMSWAYALAVRARNALFDRGCRRMHRAAVPVVSIGNLTTGGTGKTPFAAFVARSCADRGVRVSFVSRGYRAADGGPNDEALVLEQLCPGTPHVQDADRVRGAAWAAKEFGSQLVILDDGFQHRRLARDLDIVLVDATNPWGYGHLLPRGLLREPPVALARAQLVVLTRVDQVPGEEIDNLRCQIAEIAPGCPIAEVAFPPERLVGAAGGREPLESLKGARVAAFCGIGNPRAFRASLESLGCLITGFREYPDHHRYTAVDLEKLGRWASELGAAAVVCTQKDLVKIGAETLGNRPLWALAIGARVVRGEDLLITRLSQVLISSPSHSAGSVHSGRPGT